MGTSNFSGGPSGRSIKLAMLAGTCLAASSLTPALAQTAAAPVATSSQIEEVVVTAQKRSESAQNVPISITALSGEQVRASGVTDTQDLKAAVPALNMTTGVGGFGLPRIRGVGATGQGPGIENPVAVYVDGVYYGASFGVLQSLFDVDQVAVLKGPQGTLFGRNATGGLIQISTLAPRQERTGKVQVGYGNYETTSVAGFFTGGLSDKIAASLSGQYEDRADGYGKNLATGHDIQDGKSWAVRGKLLIEPTDVTSLLLSADHNGRDAAEPAFRNFGRNTLGTDTDTAIVLLGGDKKRDIIADLDPSMRARQWGTSATLVHNFGAVELKSITAYRESKLGVIFDPDGLPVPNIRILNDYEDKQFTQEINLLSQTDGPFKWVLGAFYMQDTAKSTGRTTGNITFGGRGYNDLFGTVDLKSYSAFAEGTYTLGENTNFIAGVRYTSDKRDLSTYGISFNGNTNVTTTSATLKNERTNKKATFRLSLDHRFSSNLLAYASFNRGFRSGAFLVTTPIITLEPEGVDAYEVGLKSDLFDRRVRANLSAYRYDQTNIQVMQVIAGVQSVYNANGAKIYGLDGDITWQVSSNLRLFGGFNLTHARYKDFPNAILSYPYPLAASFVIPTGQTCLGTFGNARTQVGGNCLLRGDASGKRLQNTPDMTYSLGGTFDIPTEVGEFTLAGNVYYNDGFAGSPDGRVVQDNYTTVDGSVSWRNTADKLTVRVWGKNLSDAHFRTQIGASNSGDNGTTAPPRTFGITVGYDF